jgi:hypothetical protein
MKEASVESVQSAKEMLSDDTGSFPEEACFRKCLYIGIGVLTSDGDTNVSEFR